MMVPKPYSEELFTPHVTWHLEIVKAMLWDLSQSTSSKEAKIANKRKANEKEKVHRYQCGCSRCVGHFLWSGTDSDGCSSELEDLVLEWSDSRMLNGFSCILQFPATGFVRFARFSSCACAWFRPDSVGATKRKSRVPNGGIKVGAEMQSQHVQVCTKRHVDTQSSSFKLNTDKMINSVLQMIAKAKLWRN